MGNMLVLPEEGPWARVPYSGTESDMREEELEVALKVSAAKNQLRSCNNYYAHQVVIVGNGGVGKSSMIQRYCKGTFTKDYKKTIGVDFLERQIEWVLFEN